MEQQQEAAKSPSFIRRVVAVVILAVAAYLLFKVVLHIILGVAWAIVAIVAIVGIIWAIRQL